MTRPTRIETYTAALSAYGYVVMMEPIPGEETTFGNTLAVAFAKVESTMLHHARQHGYRGKSKAALAALHAALPEPTWGVELKA
jgi:hypothetical protein